MGPCSDHIVVFFCIRLVTGVGRICVRGVCVCVVGLCIWE